MIELNPEPIVVHTENGVPVCYHWPTCIDIADEVWRKGDPAYLSFDNGHAVISVHNAWADYGQVESVNLTHLAIKRFLLIDSGAY